VTLISVNRERESPLSKFVQIRLLVVVVSSLIVSNITFRDSAEKRDLEMLFGRTTEGVIKAHINTYREHKFIQPESFDLGIIPDRYYDFPLIFFLGREQIGVGEGPRTISAGTDIDRLERHKHLRGVAYPEGNHKAVVESFYQPFDTAFPVVDINPLSQLRFLQFHGSERRLGSLAGFVRLPTNKDESGNGSSKKPPFGILPSWLRFVIAVACLWIGCLIVGIKGRSGLVWGIVLGEIGTLIFLTGMGGG
jgi:hypothetical protein